MGYKQEVEKEDTGAFRQRQWVQSGTESKNVPRHVGY